MPLLGPQVELPLPGGLPPTLVALLRGNADDRVRRVHHQHDDLLERTVRVLDLVVDRRTVLSPEASFALVTLALASVAGFSQLFSP
jgi:hypothetical protein